LVAPWTGYSPERVAKVEQTWPVCESGVVGWLQPFLTQGEEMNILFFDLETTGLDPKRHGIVEVAAQLYSNGELVDTFFQAIDLEDLVTRGRKVDMSAMKVNGITFYNQKERCVQRNINFVGKEDVVLRNFADWLVGATLKVEGKTYVAGQNIGFDIGFIKQAFANHDIEGWDSAVSYRTIDTSGISRFLIDAGAIRVSDNVQAGSGLAKIALSLGIEIRDRTLHTALEDVKLTAEVYFAMKKKMEQLCQGQKQN